MSERTNDEVRRAVRVQYGQIAGEGGGCCGPRPCGPGPSLSGVLGYTAADMASVPEGANLGLGCGNPQALAALRPGERVLDLGAGGGFDCLLAAQQVGPEGFVVGVDMTPEMVEKARKNAEKAGAGNVEFRLGEIERLPVADASIDVILSNCVINLSPDKDAVFREAFRVLTPGGRLAISDVVAIAPLPESLKHDIEALTGCVAGAVQVSELERALTAAGFGDIQVRIDPRSRAFIAQWAPGSGIEEHVASASIEAVRPAAAEARCCVPACCEEKA